MFSQIINRQIYSMYVLLFKLTKYTYMDNVLIMSDNLKD